MLFYVKVRPPPHVPDNLVPLVDSPPHLPFLTAASPRLLQVSHEPPMAGPSASREGAAQAEEAEEEGVGRRMRRQRLAGTVTPPGHLPTGAPVAKPPGLSLRLADGPPGHGQPLGLSRSPL